MNNLIRGETHKAYAMKIASAAKSIHASGAGHSILYLGAYALPAKPEERRSDQQWQRGRPMDGSSRDNRSQHGRSSHPMTDFQKALERGVRIFFNQMGTGGF